MSISLDQMAEDCSRRLAAHEMMLRHLDLDPGPKEALRVSKELRATLRACTACPTPGRCADWCRDGRHGTPRFCAGDTAFDALSRAIGALRMARVA